MGLVDGVAHGDPVVDRIDGAFRRVERGQLGIGVGECHDRLRLVLAQGGRQFLTARVVERHERRAGEDGVGGVHDAPEMRLRLGGHEQLVGGLDVVLQAVARSGDAGRVGLGHRLRNSRRARRVHDRHRVLRCVPEAPGIGQRGRGRCGQVLGELDPTQAVQRSDPLADGREAGPVGVDPHRCRALAQAEGQRRRRLAVDEHRDGAQLGKGVEVDRVGERVSDVERHAITRADALVVVPDRPALGERVDLGERELRLLLPCGVDHRAVRADERDVRVGVHGHGRRQQVAPAELGHRRQSGALFGGQQWFVGNGHRSNSLIG